MAYRRRQPKPHGSSHIPIGILALIIAVMLAIAFYGFITGRWEMQ